MPRVQGIATRRCARGSCSALFHCCFSIGPNTVARLADANTWGCLTRMIGVQARSVRVFASLSAVPWCAWDGLRWTFPPGGSRFARATTKVGEVATCEASWEWFGAGASGLAFLKCSPRVPSTRAPDPRRGAGGSKPTGGKVCVARNGRLRWTRGGNIEIFFQKARAASRCKPIQDQIVDTDAFISRAQQRLSVLEEERVREQELLDKALLQQERLRRELQQPCTLPDVSAQFQRLELRKERDDLRHKVEGRSGVWMANEPPDVNRVPPFQFRSCKFTIG